MHPDNKIVSFVVITVKYKNDLKAAVGNSPPFLTNLPFHDFSQLFQPRLVVHSFGKIVKRQVCQNRG